ncbi:Hypothetical_protein [Hexamita inflata]|uniref:Hypothetical_protein n=1 Tax=Hexamita inflata TaxID=28002 RepID=A0AA86Q263_9EUKA|nr:Hypothetical protein HINF_LOCUS31524 [Hexamita inflata]
MPFIIQHDGDYLELMFTDEQQQEIDSKLLQPSYTQININGINKSKFTHYDILCKSPHIVIIDCLIDLSQLKGEYANVSLEQCECQGQFTSQCLIKTLVVFDVTLQVRQMLKLDLDYFFCYIELNDSFDYHNCNQFKCQHLRELNISNQTVHLSSLKGNWDDLTFTNCEFIDYTFQDFQVENVYVTVSQQHSKNNLLHLFNITCGHLYVYFNDFSLDCPIILQFPKSIAKQISAYVKNCACDIGTIHGKWNTLRFTDCVLSGSADSLEFLSTNIVITNNKYIDLSALNGIRANLVVHLINQQVNLDLIQRIKVKQLTLEKCQLELSSSVFLSKAILINCECEILGVGQIRAVELIINNCNEELFNIIQAETLTVHNSKLSVLNAKEVSMSGSHLQCIQNNTVTKLHLNDCKLFNFSCLKFRQLNTFSGNFGEQNQSKMAIHRFLGFKLQNQNQVGKYEAKINFQEKKNGTKRKFNRILVSVECVLEWIIQLQIANE